METLKPETAVSILLVEDSQDDADLLRRSLRDAPFTINRVETLGEAAKALRELPFDVVLLDLSLPDGNGFDTFSRLRGNAPNAAIIVLTGLDDETMGVKTVQAGAQDYVVKGSLGSVQMTRAIRHAIERKRLETLTLEYAEELAAKNAQMRDDLQLAREVQQAFLPKACPSFPLGDAKPTLHLTPRYVPAGEVGGDFFDVIALSPTLAGVIVCDVMGHGVRAALITAMLRAMVGPQATAVTEPAQMLGELNLRLRAIMSGFDSVMFVTAVYLVVDSSNGTVKMANAGHPPPLRLEMSGIVGPLAPDQHVGPPLGLVETPDYVSQTVQLSAGDRTLLYTDGVYELEGKNGEGFGQNELKRTLQLHASQGASPFLDSVIASLRAFSRAGTFTDDACLLAMDYLR